MTHEFKELIETAVNWQQNGINAVLASVVALDGSSYRRPGVRMLLSEEGTWIGAVSGGCVEKEVFRQAQSVFKTKQAKLMSYDGRFRLGCEGILYILLEPFFVSESCYRSFKRTLNQRTEFTCNSYYQISDTEIPAMGSVLILEDTTYSLSPSTSIMPSNELDCFSQLFQPIFQLYIFGAEHDAVQLCKMANQIGWEVHVVAPPDEAKSLEYFHGAATLLTPAYDQVDSSKLDENTAVVLMTHSFSKDLQYLIALKNVEPAYLGLLGPMHRRERMFSQFLDYVPETSAHFFEKIHGPAGINIGAESASEIALSILSEILAVIRNHTPVFLKDKKGDIHG